MRETKIEARSGGWMLAVGIVGLLATAAAFAMTIAAAQPQNHDAAGAGIAAVIGVVLLLGSVATLAGLFVVQPNQARVLQLFGRYVGTVRAEGLRWANPFYTKGKVSLRAYNFETDKIKVNDVDGNPIEIAAIVTWRVVDSAQATFDVQDYASFVTVQAEAALRDLATHHPYDDHDDAQPSLRGHTDAIAGQLETEIQARIGKAGVEVTEARISHLAYAPEIAQAMLQRQQAGAIIAARTRIVEGAVGMVEMALQRLAERNVVDLDPERKAAMVSNLLVVLCGERGAQPVLNAGTLYST